jgi:general secretion pathway protein B
MSYILDALRKSDQQRRRGAAPTLLTLQPSAVVRKKRPGSLAYGLLVVVLVGAGMVVGWLRPWQPEQAAPAATAMAPQPAPEPKPELPANAKPQTDGASHEADAATPARTAAPPERRVDIAAADAAGETVISMEQLPLSIRQGLPPMTISVHAYSGNPRNRMIGIGSRILREGDAVAPGLKLEEITPDGMIFGYKGYRFRRGVK